MNLLKIGADPFPPYQYIDKNGRIDGSDYKMVKSIIDKMGYQAKYLIKEWSVIEKMFNEKEIDIVFQVQKTLEREKRWYFSEKFRDAVTSIITSLDNTNYHTINDLLVEHDKLGVISNYQYGDIIDSIDTRKKVYFKSLEELLEHVNNGKVAFGVVDLGVYNYVNKDNIYTNIKIIDSLNFNRPLYVAFNDRSLRDEFNIYLAKRV